MKLHKIKKSRLGQKQTKDRRERTKEKVQGTHRDIQTHIWTNKIPQNPQNCRP